GGGWHQPQLRRVPRRGRPAARSGLPARARTGGSLAALRWLAGQLRAGGLRPDPGDRRRSGAVVRSAPPAVGPDGAVAASARLPRRRLDSVRVIAANA